MTLPEIRSIVDARGLEQALDEVRLSEVPEDLREVWHRAVQAVENWHFRTTEILRALGEEE